MLGALARPRGVNGEDGLLPVRNIPLSQRERRVGVVGDGDGDGDGDERKL